MLLAELTTGRPQDVLDQLSGEYRAAVIALLSSMRSGRGFVNDLAQLGGERKSWEGRVAQSALVIASRCDGSVPYGHAVELARTLPRAERMDSEAAGHFVWFGPDRNRIEQLITEFLLAPGATAGGG
ncbi:alpha/beta fold hydrolase [Streptomyces anulatus]